MPVDAGPGRRQHYRMASSEFLASGLSPSPRQLRSGNPRESRDFGSGPGTLPAGGKDLGRIRAALCASQEAGIWCWRSDGSGIARGLGARTERAGCFDASTAGELSGGALRAQPIFASQPSVLE